MASICGRSASASGASRHIRAKAGLCSRKPAVAAEHGDAFGEIVERLALHADQRVEAAFEIEPLGASANSAGERMAAPA